MICVAEPRPAAVWNTRGSLEGLRSGTRVQHSRRDARRLDGVIERAVGSGPDFRIVR
jgi:hypothetical protein